MGFVNYKKRCTRHAVASDKVYQLLAHGRWFSPASSTTKTGRHDIAEILLKVVSKHQTHHCHMSDYIVFCFRTEVEMSGIEVLAVSKYSTKKAFDKSSSFIN
jgi:hypothetical protein